MAAMFLVRAFLPLIPNLPMVGDELDEATRERMAQYASFMEKETAWIWREVEERWSPKEKTQEQWVFAWEALLSTALQHWHYLVMAGGLLLLLGLCWCLRKRSRKGDSSSAEESSGCNLLKVEKEEKSEGEGPGDERDLVLNLEPVVEKEEEERNVVRSFERPSRRLVRSVMYSGQVVEELVVELLRVIKEQLCKSFYPVLQQAISVGTSFEGWLPCDEDAVYQLLLPLKAPRGHAFNLELDATRQMPAGGHCIRVELVCTCTGQQMDKNMLCFLHHSNRDITKNQDPSLLHTLCTGCYLDVPKTAHWFQNLVMSVWRDVPRLCCYKMKMLPSSRICRLELTSASGKISIIELIFGVRHGDSDIFLSSQAPEDTSTPSTTWPVTYAAAEVKFFKYMTSHVPTGHVHLRCLRYCADIVTDTSFSTYIFKTAVMHLLTTIPLSHWHSKYLVLRLRDILRYIFCCLEQKCLKHFFLGNENVPKEISLPQSFREAEPLNLFQRFTQDPVAYAEALSDFKQLRPMLLRLLTKGH